MKIISIKNVSIAFYNLDRFFITRSFVTLIINIYVFFRAVIFIVLKKEIVPKTDHYVPRLILRNFSINFKDKKGLVYSYERGSLKPVEKSINKKAGVEKGKGYYLTKNRFTKKPDNMFDDWLNSYLEHENRNLFEKMLSEKERILVNNEELSALAEFIANLYTRTPAFKVQLMHFISFLINDKVIKIKDLKSRNKLEKIFIGKEFEKYRKSLFKIKQQPNISGINNHLQIGGSLISQNISEKIFFKNFLIYEAPKGVDFIINDNPVRVLHDEKKILWPDGWDDFGEDILILVPISKKRCLIIDGGREKNNFSGIPIFSADKAFVGRVNYYMICYANDYLYSNKKDMILQKMFNKMPKLHFYEE